MTTDNIPRDIPDQPLYDPVLLEKISLLGNIRKTPLVLYGIFTELCRQFYATTVNMPLEVAYTWDPDVKKTSIWIDTEYKWEDTNPELRPAIYTKLGDIQYTSLTGRHDSSMGANLEEGEFHFSRNGAGQIQWIHIGRSKGEAVAIAGATLDYLDALSKIIKDDFCFQSFEIVSLSPLAVDKESKERYRSVVTAAFTFQDTWTLKMESPKLKRIVLSAGQEILDGIL